MVEKPPVSAGDMGSIPGRGTKIPHAAGATKPGCCSLERSPHAAIKSLYAETKTQRSQK